MGRPRMAELLCPQRGTAAENGRAETPPRHTVGTDGVSIEHGTLARHKYCLLAPAGMAVDPFDAGDPGSAAGHGTTGDQDGREPEEEGDETQQRVLPACGNNRIGDKTRGPPERSCTLITCGHPGGERGGGPPTQQCAPTTHSKGPGGDPTHGSAGPHHAAGTRRRNPPPPPAPATRARERGGERAPRLA